MARFLVEAAQQPDVYAPDCPSRAVLDHVTSRWGVLVLVALLDGPMRVEYSLTELGEEVAERLGGLVEWIQSNLARVLTPT